MIYLCILLLLLFLSFHFDVCGKKNGRGRWYLIVLLILVLLAGLRWRLGVDTPTYLRRFYYSYPSLEDFTLEDFPIGKDPFYVLINSVVKSLGGRFYMVQLVQSAFVNVLIFKYIKKHSNYIFTCVFFYYVVAYIAYSMEVMRGTMSIVVCLFANDYILEKKWIKGYMLYLIALMFHAQTIVIFVLPIFFFLRLNKIGIAVLVGAFVFGQIMYKLLGDYLLLLDLAEEIENKASTFANNDAYATQQGSLNYYIMNIFPLLIYAIISLLYIKKYECNIKLLRLEPLLMLGVLFLFMQMGIQIATRYVAYYSLYFIMFFSEFYVVLSRRAKMTAGLKYIRSFVVFLPFFILTNIPLAKGKWVRYYPYSSVIEREISPQREAAYAESNRDQANINEY